MAITGGSLLHAGRIYKSRCECRLFYVLLAVALLPSCQGVTIEEGAFNSFAFIGRNSSSNDEPSRVLTTSSNMILVGGTTSPAHRDGRSDLGVALREDLGEEDFFVSKIDGFTGEVKWVYRDGTSKEDRLHAMLADKSGDFLLVGGWTFGAFPNTLRGGQADIFVIKYNVSGDKPTEVWPVPLILGTPASESVQAFTLDPNNEDVIYATGFTTGNLFPGTEIESSIFSDAILFSFSAANGSVLHKRQFGTEFTDHGTDIVISETEDGPLFVSVVTERKIGQYSFGNFHLYKMKRDGTPLGDLLLKTYSREQVAAFRQHPMLPGTLLTSGSSWLDSRNGYDVFLKRIVSPFDNTSIGSQQIDIDDVQEEEYTKRIRSSDGSHDYATGMFVDPESGRIILSGYTGGTFAPGALKKGILAPFVASLDPLDASLTGVSQMALATEGSWEEISCIAMATGRRGLYYVAKQSDESTNQFHLAIGSFGFPALWKTPITIASTPDPTPSPRTDSERSSPADTQKKLPLIIIIGSACGAVVLILIIVAIVIGNRMGRRARAAKVYNPNKKQKMPQSQARVERLAVPKGPRVEGPNASGLV